MKFAIPVVLASIVAILLWAFLPESGVGEYTWVEVKEREFAPSLVERGTVEASDVTVVQTNISGAILSLEKENSKVKKDDFVAKIDTSDYADDIAEIEVELQGEYLNLESNKRRVEMIKSTESGKTFLKRKLWENAVLERDFQMSLPEEHTLRKLEISLELNKLDLEEADYEYRRQKNLYTKGFVSEAFLETYERRQATSQEKVREAKLNIEIAKDGITEENKVSLKLKVERTKSSLDRAEKRLKRRVEEYSDIVKVTEQKIKELKFKRDSLMEKLRHSVCYAQQDGYVLIKRFRDYRAGGVYKTYAPGVTIRERDVIGYVVSPSDMKVNAYFNESDYHFIKTDMKTSVTLPSFPGRKFSGKIKSIGAIGKDRNLWLEQLSGKSGVSMYNAEIEFDNDGADLHPGMSAAIEIFLEKPRRGLVIPRSCLISKNDSWYVVTKSGEKKISGRVISEFEFEVTEGLQIGQKVRVNVKGAE